MRKLILILLVAFVSKSIYAQNNVIDKVIAIVGDEIILQSDIENAIMQAQSQGIVTSNPNIKAELLEQQLMQKLLIAQAKVDSIFVEDSEVVRTVNDRLESMIQEIGSIERLESYFGKKISKLREDLFEPFKNNMQAERMKAKIVEKIRITPSEVKSFYKDIPKDSLPEIGAKYEIQQIVLKPNISDAEKERIRTKLREFREQITSGEKSFNTLAVLYSECGSAPHGGELDYTAKTDWDPAFAEAAFNLKPGKISKIVESEFGFHIIQMIDRKGDKVKVRHILMQPKVDENEKKEAIHRLDSIRQFINEGKITFEEAALYFSTDKKTKNNGGIIAEEMTSDIKLPKASIKGEMARVVNRIKVNEVSEPFTDIANNGMQEYKIIKVKAYYPQHLANLDEDWTIFENMLTSQKQNDKLKKWVDEKQKNTYIHIDPAYQNAKFIYGGWFK